MPNEENLIPLNKRSKSEQRKIQSAGGVASGKSRQQTASLKRAAKIFFKENPDAAMSVIVAMFQEACQGNVKAAEKLQDLIGETIQREELALKKKAISKQNGANGSAAKTNRSKLYETLGEIDGTDYDAVTEAETSDEMGTHADIPE